MKKVFIALVIVTSVVVACSPKVSKTPPPPAPAVETTAVTAGNANAGGLLISSAKCTKCHSDETGHVAKHTFGEQEKLMQGMAKKARLTPEETADLMAYVKANAKKS